MDYPESERGTTPSMSLPETREQENAKHPHGEEGVSPSSVEADHEQSEGHGEEGVSPSSVEADHEQSEGHGEEGVSPSSVEAGHEQSEPSGESPERGSLRRLPFAFRVLAVIALAPLLSLTLWYLLPNSPFSVALSALIMLSAVFLGVGSVLRSRSLSQTPGRNPSPSP